MIAAEKAVAAGSTTTADATLDEPMADAKAAYGDEPTAQATAAAGKAIEAAEFGRLVQQCAGKSAATAAAGDLRAVRRPAYQERRIGCSIRTLRWRVPLQHLQRRMRTLQAPSR